MTIRLSLASVALGLLFGLAWRQRQESDNLVLRAWAASIPRLVEAIPGGPSGVLMAFSLLSR